MNGYGERAGNADGTIPAWNGGITKPPEGYKPGDHHPDLPVGRAGCLDGAQQAFGIGLEIVVGGLETGLGLVRVLVADVTNAQRGGMRAIIGVVVEFLEDGRLAPDE